MARGAVFEGSGVCVESADAQGCRLRPRHEPTEFVYRGEAFGDTSTGEKVQSNRGSQLSHHRRGLDAVPDDVADDEKDAAGMSGHRLEPVAAGPGVLGGHQIFGRDVQARQHRQRR